MDELTLLRDYDREVAPREEVLEASRRSLEAAMRRADQDRLTVGHRRSRRRPAVIGVRASAPATTRPASTGGPRLPRRAVLVGFGAVAATCTAVVLFNIGGVPAAPANAAETLRAAAAATEATNAPVQGVTQHVQRFIASTLTDGGRSADGGPALIEETETLRPIRGGSDWVSTSTAPHAVQAWGKDPQEAIDSINRDTAAPAPSYLSKTTPSAFWRGLDPAQIRALPHDPDALLQRLIEMPDVYGEAYTRTDRAFMAALSVLGSGLADSGLQSATYRALTLLPDLRTSRGTDIDGRRGIVVSSPAKPGKDDLALIIDPSSGRFLGYAETHVTALGGAPAGTIEHAAAYYFDR